MDFSVDFSGISPAFCRPELLTHPNIPRPAHGLNPRTIKGRRWWDDQRSPAYAKNNYCCWACGGYPGDNPYDQRLQAHECYRIHYYIGIIELAEIVALCYSCHNYIHSGRMRLLWQNGKMSRDQVEDILVSRTEILKEAGLEPYYATKALYYCATRGMEFYSALMEVDLEGLTDRAYFTLPTQDEHWILVVGDEAYGKDGKRVA